MTLEFYAVRAFIREIGDFLHISRSSASWIIRRTTSACRWVKCLFQCEEVGRTCLVSEKTVGVNTPRSPYKIIFVHVSLFLYNCRCQLFINFPWESYQEYYGNTWNYSVQWNYLLRKFRKISIGLSLKSSGRRAVLMVMNTVSVVIMSVTDDGFGSHFLSCKYCQPKIS